MARIHPWALFYLSLPSCGVCTALKPKVDSIARDHQIPVFYVDLEKIPLAGGQWNVFTIPGVLLYVQGRESWRGLRFLDLRDLEDQIDRLQGILFSR